MSASQATTEATTEVVVPPASQPGNLSMRVRMVAAFAAIYVIWGSTYLAIRFAIETIPPFLMAGTRFLIAGTLMYVLSRRGGAAQPTRRQWIGTAIVGTLLLAAGNGGIVWAEQRGVPSSLVALLLALTPLWMTLLDWLRRGGVRPTRGVVGGLVLGFAGIALLVGPEKIAGGASAGADSFGIVLVIVGALAWAAGSIYSRYASMPDSPLLSTGMEMLAGGAVLLLASFVAGDWARFDIAAVSLRSLGAYAYLIFVGALVAFTAYVWLLKHAPPARVATYAYVNPVIAVFLGWALAGEPLTLQTLAAAAVIIAGVAIVITYRSKS